MARKSKSKRPEREAVAPFPCPEFGCPGHLVAVDDDGVPIDLERQGAAQWFCSERACEFGIDAHESSTGPRCPADGAPLTFDPELVGMTCGGLALKGWNRCAHCGGTWVTRRAVPAVDMWRLASSGRSLDAGPIRLRAEAKSGGNVPELMTRIMALPALEDIARRLSTLAKVRHAIPDFDRAFDELVAAARAAVAEEPTIVDESEGV